MSTIPLLQEFISSKGTNKNRVLLFVNALRLNHIAMISRFNEVYDLLGECCVDQEQMMEIIGKQEEASRRNVGVIEKFEAYGNKYDDDFRMFGFDIVCGYEGRIGEELGKMNAIINVLRTLMDGECVDIVDREYYECMVDSEDDRDDTIEDYNFYDTMSTGRMKTDGMSLMDEFFAHQSYIVSEINDVIRLVSKYVEYEKVFEKGCNEASEYEVRIGRVFMVAIVASAILIGGMFVRMIV